jgi:hypothetical protein
MPSKPSPAPEVQTLLTGLAFGESPRWHTERLWFADWGKQQSCSRLISTAIAKSWPG